MLVSNYNNRLLLYCHVKMVTADLFINKKLAIIHMIFVDSIVND